MIENRNFEQESIIVELESIIEKEDYHISNLEKYNIAYHKSVLNYSQICDKCIEWQELNLPNDCLCTPDYCVKFKSDFLIIQLYEELKLKIELVVN